MASLEQSLHFDTSQFAGRHQYPVGADFGAHGEVHSTGISFEDYRSMHVEERAGCGQRRNHDRDWAFCDTKVRQVIARTMEVRACIRIPNSGTEVERIALAEKKIQKEIRPLLKARLDTLCRNYAQKRAAGATPEELAKLENAIKGADTHVRMSRPNRVPEILVAIVYRFFRLAKSNTEIAEALDLNPGTVRKLIYNLEQTAGELGFAKRAKMRVYKYTAKTVLSEDDIVELVKMRKNGATMEELCNHFRVAHAVIRGALPKNLVGRRLIDRAEAIRLRADGMSLTALAKKYGVSKTTPDVLLLAPRPDLRRSKHLAVERPAHEPSFTTA